MPKVKLAILDDYQSVAPSFFTHLSDRVEVTSFPQTLNAKDATQRAELISRLQPFTVLSTMRERTALPAEVISALPNLKLVLTTGVWNAAIDMHACTEKGVIVTGATGMRQIQKYNGGSAPNPSTAYLSTTEQTWALILSVTRNTARDDAAVKAGGWQGGFATGLAGKTLGVLGLGRLGVMTAKIAVLAFGMRVVAWSSSLTQGDADERAEKAGLEKGSFAVARSKIELFREADVVSVHYVLSGRSKGIVGSEELAATKSSAFLVNTSRGPLIDEAALLKHVKAGKIKGVALDVFDIEPLHADSEWRTVRWGEEGRSEVVLSPHVGYVEEPTILSWYDEQADSLERWLDGRDQLSVLND